MRVKSKEKGQARVWNLETELKTYVQCYKVQS